MGASRAAGAVTDPRSGVGGGSRIRTGFRAVAGLRAAAAAGAAMVLLPALGVSSPAQPLTVAGLLLVAASVVGPLARWTATGSLAGTAAVILSAVARPGIAVLTAEGLLILVYLLLLDAPRHGAAPLLARWLRQQAPTVAWAAAAVAVVDAALAVTVPAAVWLVVTGTVAAVAATVVALPRLPRHSRDLTRTADPAAVTDPQAVTDPEDAAGP